MSSAFVTIWTVSSKSEIYKDGEGAPSRGLRIEQRWGGLGGLTVAVPSLYNEHSCGTSTVYGLLEPVITGVVRPLSAHQAALVASVLQATTVVLTMEVAVGSKNGDDKGFILS